MGLIVFAVSKGIAKALISGTVSVVSMLVNPVIEITASLALGAALGWIFSEIEKYFNSTFALCKNTEGKAEAQREYASLFKHFDNEEQARERAAKIYKAFRTYIENLKDDKYCKTFSRWLKSEIPTEWWK